MNLQTPLFKVPTIKDALLFAGIIIIIFMLIFRGGSDPVYPVTPEAEIQKRNAYKKEEIKIIETRVSNTKEIIEEISGQLMDLKAELLLYKSKRDTVTIIRIQDTIINVLEVENSYLETVVLDQDSIIDKQSYIIDSKDTIIEIKNHENKRIKKHRNGAVIATAILTGILIFKK